MAKKKEMSQTEMYQAYLSSEQSVFKSNELARSRFDLSLSEQKAVAFICSLIPQPDRNNPDSQGVTYSFSIQNYCNLCGITYNGGRQKNDVKQSFTNLMEKVTWIKQPDGKEVSVRWLYKVWLDWKSDTGTVQLDEDMMPYLLNLYSRFTSYQLKNVLSMRSKHSIHLFEILVSYAHQWEVEFEVDELKRILAVDDVASYNDFSLFRRKVLDVAVLEINAYTDIKVSYEPSKKIGKKVTHVKFDISDYRRKQITALSD